MWLFYTLLADIFMVLANVYETPIVLSWESMLVMPYYFLMYAKYMSKYNVVSDMLVSYSYVMA